MKTFIKLTSPREIEYTVLAYMTLANTQTILVHLT